MNVFSEIISWLAKPFLRPLEERCAIIALVRWKIKFGEISGRDLREWLATQGHRLSGPQFYEIMADVDAKYDDIVACDKPTYVAGQILMQRYFLPE